MNEILIGSTLLTFIVSVIWLVSINVYAQRCVIVATILLCAIYLAYTIGETVIYTLYNIEINYLK